MNCDICGREGEIEGPYAELPRLWQTREVDLSLSPIDKVTGVMIVCDQCASPTGRLTEPSQPAFQNIPPRDRTEEARRFVEAVRVSLYGRVTETGKPPGPKNQGFVGSMPTSATASLKPDKGVFNGSCNRTACQQPSATFYNIHTNAYYCAQCARTLNERSLEKFVFPEGHPQHPKTPC